MRAMKTSELHAAPPRTRGADRTGPADRTQASRTRPGHISHRARTRRAHRRPRPLDWTGRRDHAIITLLAQTGLRASELTGLACGDIHLGAGAHVATTGKGRKQRITPLTKDTVALLRVWLDERAGQPAEPLFPTSTGKPLTRKALARRIAKHAADAGERCASLTSKTITPHVLRPTAAMRLLHADVDTTVIALWLGHEQASRNHADVPPRRPRHQRTSTRPHQTTGQQTRPLPPARCAPRIPRRALTTWSAPSAVGRVLPCR